jgi:HAD superfamily hydrolase (TIGR01549 family)
MIRAVFFDVGNTLFFYNYAFLSNLLIERFEIDLDPRELEAVHYSIGDRVQQIVGEGKDHQAIHDEIYGMWFKELDIDEELIPDIVDAIRKHPFPHMFWARMGEGVCEMLEWFRERSFKLGVISNAEGQIERLLKHVGVYEYFDVVLDSKLVRMEKPDVRIFLKALEGVGVEPHEAVHVGDLLETDIKGAREVGMVPVLIDREGRHAGSDVLSVRHVREVTELPIFDDRR